MCRLHRSIRRDSPSKAVFLAWFLFEGLPVVLAIAFILAMLLLGATPWQRLD